jgi:uncharacterized protein (TIGR03083 family)
LSATGKTGNVISARYERERLAILGLLDEATGDEPVPTCPGWTVADVVRHLIGLCDDWLTGRLEVYASPEWTAQQVAAFASVPTQELRSEWDLRSTRFCAFLDDPTSADHLGDMVRTVIGTFPTSSFPGGIVVDLTQHVADVSSALGRDPMVDPDDVAVCNRSMSFSLGRAWRHFGVPSVIIRTTDSGEEYALGDDPTLKLEATSFDLFRTLGGRRAAAQTQALDWTGSADDIAAVSPLLTVPFFAAPEQPVESVIS